jgi:SAM-dependent methyltransferase
MNQNSINPNPLTDPVVPAITSMALITAERAGLFDAINSGCHSPAEIAERQGADPAGIERVVAVLAACGYLSRTEQGYELTEVSRATLLPGGEYDFRNWLRFSRWQVTAALSMEEVLRSREPLDLLGMMDSDGERLSHQRAMAETARPIAEWIADQIPLPAGAARMIDIGGSHGLYAAALCRRQPGMRATVYELPSMVEYAQQVSRELGTNTYCEHVGADFMTASVDRRCDLTFIGNLLHHYTRPDAAELFRKIHRCLAPGGRIAVWDLFEIPGEQDVTGASFSLLFYLTSGTRCFTAAETEQLLAEAGFADVQLTRPPGTSTHALLTACRPADS